MKIDYITSRTIDNIRLPLIIGVVLIHSNLGIPIVRNELGHGTISGFVRYLLCEDITRCCVPIFFFISSYLLFSGVKDYSKSVYLRKVRSRTKSLLVPYVLWGMIAFVLYCSKTIIHGEATSGYILDNLYYALIGGGHTHLVLEPYCVPFDFPLWFIRDLYVYILISPIFYYAIKKAGKIILILLSVCFLAGWWINILFFSITGVLFFSLGTYFALNGIEPSRLISAHPSMSKIICYVYPFVMLLDALSYIYMADIRFYAHTTQIFMGSAALWIYFHKFTLKYPDYRSRITPNAVFAVFVLHGIFNNYLRKRYFLFDFASQWGRIACCIYMFVGMLVLSFATYFLIKRLIPRIAPILFGNREIPKPL